MSEEVQSFDKRNEFVLGRAVVLLYLMLYFVPPQNDVLCAGCFSGELKRMALLRQGWWRHSLQGHQDLEIGAGLSQATLRSRVAHGIPPPIPPPTWNNEPLQLVVWMVLSCWRIRLPMTCFLSVPMVSGHNCFGSVCIQ